MGLMCQLFLTISYQHICLIAKSSTIQDTIRNLYRKKIYEFGKFMQVLFVGLESEVFLCISDGDFGRAFVR